MCTGIVCAAPSPVSGVRFRGLGFKVKDSGLGTLHLGLRFRRTTVSKPFSDQRAACHFRKAHEIGLGSRVSGLGFSYGSISKLGHHITITNPQQLLRLEHSPDVPRSSLPSFILNLGPLTASPKPSASNQDARQGRSLENSGKVKWRCRKRLISGRQNPEISPNTPINPVSVSCSV